MSVNRYSKEEKVMKPIIPPEELDIGRFVEDSSGCIQGSKYNLAAQIVHVGNSKNSGIQFRYFKLPFQNSICFILL